jgi:hypothetical protein
MDNHGNDAPTTLGSEYGCITWPPAVARTAVR